MRLSAARASFYLANYLLLATACRSASSRVLADSDVPPASLGALALDLPRPIVPGFSGEALYARMASDNTFRRQVGWQVLKEALAPIGSYQATGEGLAVSVTPLPRVLAWYDPGEIVIILRRILSMKRTELQISPAGLDYSRLPEVTGADIDRFLPPGGLDQEAMAERVRTALATRPFVVLNQAKVLDGQTNGTQLGQTINGTENRSILKTVGFTLYSPSYVRHLLKNYRSIVNACPPVPKVPVESHGPLEPSRASLVTAWSHGILAASASAALCLSEEFPPDAAEAKVAWIPLGADGHVKVPVYQTGQEDLAQALHGNDWQAARYTNDVDISKADLDQQNPALISLRRGGTDYILLGLHVISRQTRELLWTTMWWHPDASSDFGADRDAALAHAGLWEKRWLAHYKMCNVVAFTEGDAAWRQNELLRSTYDNMNTRIRQDYGASAIDGPPPTWCSNPYIETRKLEQMTNCIGCHQHAGTGYTFQQTVLLKDTFAAYGNVRQRSYYPGDFSWSLEAFAVRFTEVLESIAAGGH